MPLGCVFPLVQAAQSCRAWKEHLHLTKKKSVIKTIHIRKFGLAVGLTWALLYLGCALLMMTVGREGTVLFFNTLLHGLDTSSIIRMGVPFYEFCIGLVESFILGWLVGACIAGIYNFSMAKK